MEWRSEKKRGPRAAVTQGRTYLFCLVSLSGSGGADWRGLVLGRVESWVRTLGFPPFFSFPHIHRGSNTLPWARTRACRGVQGR